MHEQVVQVAFARPHVLISREPRDPLLVNEHSEWIHPVNESVYPQVELKSVDEVGLVHVALGHVLLSRLQIHIFVFSHEEDAPALAEVDWLDDECLHFLLRCSLKLSPEIGRFLGQNPGLGKDVVVVFEDSLHPLEVPAEVVLPCELVHAWEVVDPLIVLQPGQLLRHDSLRIVPVNVPICSFIISHLKAETSAGFLHLDLSL